MDVKNSHLKQIIKANNEDRLAIFVGSGISKSSDTETYKLPLWEELIFSMRRELEIKDENDYLKIAQLYFLEFGETSYYGKIKSFFPDNVPPSELHKLIFELNPNCVITTNWDCILEAAVDATGALYSLICSDQDLVKSTNQKKLIKMHGDFNNHNLVFKESDYLSYSHNFPLIENYIKSILSTHTVLFLGYGYNDINLKHITKWIQNHSDYCPPMYLVNSSNNVAQTNYLKSHGIKTISVGADLDNIISRFESLPKRSKPIAKLLDDIKNEKFQEEESLSDEEVLSVVHDKLKHLEGLNFILLEQISRSLTNCGFKYAENGVPILELYPLKGVLTTNYSESVRQINERLVSILRQEEESELPKGVLDTLDKIMLIFAKANIAGVITGEDDSRRQTYFVNPYLPSSKNEYELLNFSFDKPKVKSSHDLEQLFRQATYFYNICNFEQAYQITLVLVTTCKRQKNYTQLLIALSNLNILIFKLKYSSRLNSNNDYEELQPIDIQEQFLQLPKADIRKQQVLFDLVSLKSIFQQSVNNSNNLLKITGSVEDIKSGGIHFNNDAEKPTAEHINWLLFSVKNYLLLSYDEFNEMMARFVEISIARQLLKPEITLNVYEIYSCIKYFKEKKLQSLLSKYFDYDDETKKNLVVSKDDLNWLITDVLVNVIEQHLRADSVFEYKEKEFRNVVCLLSYLKLDKGQTDFVLQTFSKLLSSKQNTINTYESINYFFAYQYNLFECVMKTDLLLDLIENIISKVVYRTASGWDDHVIKGGTFDNVYGYIEVNKGVYSNVSLVQKLTHELNDKELNEKISYSKTLLYSIFRIGNEEVKSIIQQYIGDVISFSAKSESDHFEFMLWCVAVDFLDDVTEEMLGNLEEHLEKYVDGKTFLGSFYNLKNLINFLIDKKSIKALEAAQKQLEQLIDNYESRPNLSSV